MDPIVNENSINNQDKEKKRAFHSSQTEEYNPGDRPSEALRTIPPVRNRRKLTHHCKAIIL